MPFDGTIEKKTSMKLSIIIPNFNGADLLEKNLPAVLQTKADEIIVVDDASQDQSISILEKFSNIKLIKHEKNKGYGQSINDGVEASNGDIVVFLNTDVCPHTDFLEPLLPYFDRKEVFAVNCHEPGRSWARGAFINGYFHHEPGSQTENSHISLYASGGSAAFSKEKFIQLGLYDPLYHPFYWEDTDISYRAWKRGWEVWWEPQAVVEHQTSSTINKYFSKQFKDFIVQRNELIFNWKNITDEDLFSQHKDAVIKRILMHPGYIRPFWAALQKKRSIQERRKKEKSECTLLDKEIFSLFT